MKKWAVRPHSARHRQKPVVYVNNQPTKYSGCLYLVYYFVKTGDFSEVRHLF